jgi:hypothetical protein
MRSSSPVTQSGPDKSAVDSTVEYLILEIVRYYSIGQDLVAAVHAVETMGFRIGYQLAERCANASSSYPTIVCCQLALTPSVAILQTDRGHGTYGRALGEDEVYLQRLLDCFVWETSRGPQNKSQSTCFHLWYFATWAAAICCVTGIVCAICRDGS